MGVAPQLGAAAAVTQLQTYSASLRKWTAEQGADCWLQPLLHSGLRLWPSLCLALVLAPASRRSQGLYLFYPLGIDEDEIRFWRGQVAARSSSKLRLDTC